jgi:hypothetical protein
MASKTLDLPCAYLQGRTFVTPLAKNVQFSGSATYHAQTNTLTIDIKQDVRNFTVQMLWKLGTEPRVFTAEGSFPHESEGSGFYDMTCGVMYSDNEFEYMSIRLDCEELPWFWLEITLPVVFLERLA